MSGLRERLIQAFWNKEYRESYATEHLNSSIASQLVTVREQRGLSQTDLAKLLGTQQSGIARIESEDYGRWNIKTLREIAFHLGCRLRVSLETYGTLIDEAESISRDSLKRDAFEQDPVFLTQDSVRRSASEPVRWMQDLLLPWLADNHGSPATLLEWLSGRSLPPFGDDEPPQIWIMRALPDGRQGTGYLRLVERVAAVLDLPASDPAAAGPYAANLYSLAAELEAPRELFPKLYAAYQAILDGHFAPPPNQRGALRSALKANQSVEMSDEQIEALKSLWIGMIDGETERPLYGNFVDGWQGVKLLPPNRNVDALALALKRFEVRRIRSEDRFLPSSEELLRELATAGCFGDVNAWVDSMIKNGWDAEVTQCWWLMVAPDLEAQFQLVQRCEPRIQNLVIGIGMDWLGLQAVKAPGGEALVSFELPFRTPGATAGAPQRLGKNFSEGRNPSEEGSTHVVEESTLEGTLNGTALPIETQAGDVPTTLPELLTIQLPLTNPNQMPTGKSFKVRHRLNSEMRPVSR